VLKAFNDLLRSSPRGEQPRFHFDVDAAVTLLSQRVGSFVEPCLSLRTCNSPDCGQYIAFVPERLLNARSRGVQNGGGNDILRFRQNLLRGPWTSGIAYALNEIDESEV
jgi:hypothetical protein